MCVCACVCVCVCVCARALARVCVVLLKKIMLWKNLDCVENYTKNTDTNTHKFFLPSLSRERKREREGEGRGEEGGGGRVYIS